MVPTDEEAWRLGTGDHVHVTGTVLGAFDRENAFGATASAVEVEVEVDTVERVEPVVAVDPTQEMVEVGRPEAAKGSRSRSSRSWGSTQGPRGPSSRPATRVSRTPG